MQNNLQQVLNFSDDDLEANRAGKLSDAQRLKLEAALGRSSRVLKIITAITLVSVFLALILGGFGSIGFGTIALLLAIVEVVEYLASYRAYHHDLDTPRIETAQGVIEYVRDGGSSLLDTELRPSGIRMGGIKFLLMEDQAISFEEGEVYILYYAPVTERLLSAELAFVQDDGDEGEIVYWGEAILEEVSDFGGAQ